MNNPNIDINKIVADLLTSYLDKFTAAFCSKSKERIDAVKAQFGLCFKSYLINSYNKYSKIKTLLYSTKSIDINEIYVDPIIGVNNGIDSKNIDKIISLGNHIVFTGSAGIGKSTFLKKLFLDSISSKKNGFPILLELRHTNSFNGNIIEFIKHTFELHDNNISIEQIECSLKSGLLTLILDGYDEIDPIKREAWTNYIVEISTKYPKSKIYISSRPNSELNSLEGYTFIPIQPLTKKKSITLIQKIDFDSTIKAKFINDLEENLYERHQSFSSNPLLLTMMLLTYSDFAEVPERIHIFYSQAFDTLFRRHDALKPTLYKRKTYSNLDIDKFKSLLSSFSIITFSKKSYSFTRDEAYQYIKSAISISGVDTDVELFFNDLIESLCILIKDGLIYTFSHRSFQEYFSAYYLSNVTSDSIYDMIETVFEHHSFNETIQMLIDMNKDRVEKYWILPKFKTILDELESIPGDDKYNFNIIKMFYTTLSYTYHEKVGIILMCSLAPNSVFLALLSRCGYTNHSEFGIGRDDIVIDNLISLGQYQINFDEFKSEYLRLNYKYPAQKIKTNLYKLYEKLEKSALAKKSNLEDLLLSLKNK